MKPYLFSVLLRTLPFLLLGVPPAWSQVDRSYKTTPLMRLEVQTLVKMLEHYHYNKQAVSSADYPRLISDYMSELDPQRLFFTADDEKTFLRQYGPRLETDLAYLGNIDAAFAIFRVYEQRVQQRVAWLFDRLPQETEFTSQETYRTDRSKSPWPAAGAEADDLWTRRLKFELIQDMLGNEKSIDDARNTVRKRYERMLKNVADLEPSDLQELYLSSLTKMYDPHSSYLSADTLEDFSIQMRLSLVGIGAVLGLEDDGYCIVREVVPGGPADLSGAIRTNDKIISVQQDGQEPVEVIGMKLRRIVDMIRGPKDTKVHLTILPHDSTDSAKTRQVLITRDLIKLNSARAFAAVHSVPGDDGTAASIGVITLNSFYDGSSDDANSSEHRNTASEDVAELLGKLQHEGVDAIVIDLRRNGGGLLSEAIEMTGLFIPNGPVVQVRDSLGRLTVDNDEDARVAYSGPLAILTSRFSASASEIFAGALQNYGRAVVVGDSSTHGKGTVQAVLEMKNYLSRLSPDVSRAGAAKLTIQKFYLPNGASTQQKGVVPDITLPSIDDHLGIGEAELPHALVWDEIKPASFEGKPLERSFVQPLLQASLERQDTLEEFAYLKRGVERFRLRQERKEVSLNLEVRRAEKADDDGFRKSQEAERERLAKANYPTREVRLDSVIAAEANGTKSPSAALDAGDTDVADAESSVRFDVHLRESLRVVTDALRLSRDRQYWADGHGPITAAVAPSGKG